MRAPMKRADRAARRRGNQTTERAGRPGGPGLLLPGPASGTGDHAAGAAFGGPAVVRPSLPGLPPGPGCRGREDIQPIRQRRCPAAVPPDFHTPVVPSDKDAPSELGTDGPRSILVGIDGSATAARAGWYAAGLARRQGARVTAVFVARRSAGPAADGRAARGGFPWRRLRKRAAGLRRSSGSWAFPSPSSPPAATPSLSCAAWRRASVPMPWWWGRLPAPVTGWSVRWPCGWLRRLDGRSPWCPEPGMGLRSFPGRPGR